MKTKTFDSVRLMRELRSKLSEDMAQMAPEERTRFIQRQAARAELAIGEPSRAFAREKDGIKMPSIGS